MSSSGSDRRRTRNYMRKLIDDYRIVVGSPEYLQRRGTPATPEELETHDCVHYRGVGAQWRLVSLGGETVEVRAGSRLRSNSGEVALDWALAGCGLVMNSWVDVREYLRLGRLVHVLPSWRSDPAPSAHSSHRAASYRPACACSSTPWLIRSVSALVDASPAAGSAEHVERANMRWQRTREHARIA
jgi:DNA-binding transcriptional LysR family regulator